MLKLRTMATCILFLGAIESAQATPFGSNDIVYIDGLPCNRACQSYMAWFGRASKPRQTAPVSIQPLPLQLIEQPPKAKAERKVKARQDRPNSTPPVRLAKKAVKPIEVPPAKIVGLQPADRGEVAPVPPEKLTEAPPISNPASGSDAGATPEQVAVAPVAEDPTTSTAGPALEQKAESNTEASGPAKAIPPAVAETTALASPSAADQSDAGTTPQQAAPAPAVEDLTTAPAAPALDRKAESNTEAPAPAEATPPADAETTTALASPNIADQLVAILLVRPEIKSISDLANKVVAIDASRSESVAGVRTAIVAAGAAEVQISAREALALTRVIDGEVPAAVVTLASPEEAEMWSGVQGLKILRVPLSPPSENARRG
jgi:hypothetical protein